MTPSEVAWIVRNPDWLAHRYDPTHDAIHFINAPREAHRRATFLLDAELPSSARPFVVARAEAIAAAPPPAPVHFIFHSAFCCSTLLARAFDIEGVSMGLKEPVILNDIVGWRLNSSVNGPRVAQVLDEAMRLLARPFAPGEGTIVKPSNVVNALAPAMLALRPAASALLLYAPLETYLRSVAKKGIDGRLWVRDLLAKLLREGLIDLGLAGDDYIRLTDLQAAAVGWLAQHALFARLAAEYPQRVRTLDSETLMAEPERCVAALATLYGLDLDPVAVTAGSAFTTHSKSGQAFDARARLAEYDVSGQVHGDEIAKVLVWAAAVADSANLRLELPVSL